jgi:hypothetical protein
VSVDQEIVDGEVTSVRQLPSTRLAGREVAEWTPRMVISVDDAVEMVAQRDMFMARVMRKDVDYGVIPGTGTKPTLLKPGAERLLAAYGLHPELEDEAAPIIDMDGAQHGGEAFFQFRRRCRVWRQTGPGEADRMLIAQASGECNSWESRYRYRWTGSGDQRRRVKNEDPADQLNTILKMADKRAMVAAAILATNWSDIVTQDLDDVSTAGGGERQPSPARRSDSSEEDFGPCTEPGCPGRLIARVVKARGQDKRIVKCTNERYGDRGTCDRKADFQPNWQWYQERRDRIADTGDGERTSPAAAHEGEAPSTTAPPSGTVTRVELVATAIERGREYKRLDAVACEKLLRDHGWSGEGKESQWIATITEGGKLISLISDLNSRIASCPAPIPM